MLEYDVQTNDTDSTHSKQQLTQNWFSWVEIDSVDSELDSESESNLNSDSIFSQLSQFWVSWVFRWVAVCTASMTWWGLIQLSFGYRCESTSCWYCSTMQFDICHLSWHFVIKSSFEEWPRLTVQYSSNGSILAQTKNKILHFQIWIKTKTHIWSNSIIRSHPFLRRICWTIAKPQR